MDITTKSYSTVEGKDANLARYNELLKQMAVLSAQLIDAAPVEQYGQLERAEMVQDLVAASQTEFEEDTEIVYTIQVA